MEAISDLVELEFAAIAAYDTAIENLQNYEYKSKLQEFKYDHKVHINSLSDFLEEHNLDVPQGPGGKQWLTKGKVALANMLGDRTILRAMVSNECDTNLAYERMCERNDKIDDVMILLKAAFEDEKRHKAWMERELEKVDVW
jgi:hypothetical protein